METTKKEVPEAVDWKKPTLLALGGIILTYILLFTKYYVYYVDDTWFMSRALGYWQSGLTEDFLFRTPDAPDRTLLFEKGYYWFSSQVLNVIGWTKGNAHLISAFFISLNAALWYFILRHFGFSRKLKITFSLFSLILPVFFGAANVARPDAMALFFASFSFYAFLKRWYAPSAFLLLVAIESHLMGLTGGFYILAYFITRWKYFLESVKKFLWMAIPFLLGLIGGMGYYYLLHQDDLSYELLHTILTIKKEMNGPIANYYLRYFIQGYWYRHVWEVFYLGIGIYLYVKNKLWTEDRFVFIFPLVMLASSFITSRPNWHYMIFAYPSLLLLACYAYEKSGHFVTMLKSVTLVLVILYGAHFFFNYNYRFEKIMSETREAITKPDIPIVGMPDNWFVEPTRTFYPIYHSVKYIPDLNLAECYLIETDYISRWSKNYDEMITYFKNDYDCQVVKTFVARGEDEITVNYCRQ